MSDTAATTRSAGVIDAARAFLGERITTNAALREHHSHDGTPTGESLPDAVSPSCREPTEEISQLLALCHAARVPVVPWGGGTGSRVMSPRCGAASRLVLSRMTKVPCRSAEESPTWTAASKAGVTRDQLNSHLRELLGLFFPVDPGTAAPAPSVACAQRASGTNAVRYGTMRENAMGLTVVLPDGRVIRTGGRVRKSPPPATI